MHDKPAKKTRNKKPSKHVYIFKVQLNFIKPPIYRIVSIPGNRTLDTVSYIFESAMGWCGGHLHFFEIGETVYGEPSPDDWDPIINEKRYRLDDLCLRKKSKFRYVYDFGDDWEHTITVIDILQADHTDDYIPLVLDGERACPPEDCGGVPGYYSILEALKKPEHERSEEDKEILAWLPEDYNPEFFDRDRANNLLFDC